MDTVSAILYVKLFSTKSIDINSPEIQQYITNSCNFYYDKTGKWWSTGDVVPDWSQEFEQIYGKVPSAVTELSK